MLRGIMVKELDQKLRSLRHAIQVYSQGPVWEIAAGQLAETPHMHPGKETGLLAKSGEA
jgi:hypothetical protein